MSHLIPISTDQVYPVVTVMETIEALLDKTYGKPIDRNQIASEEVIEGIRHVTVTVPDSPYCDGIKMRPAANLVVTALANGDLHGIIKIEGEGQFYRLPRRYWVGLDYLVDLEAFTAVLPNFRGTLVDPRITGSVIVLAEKAVTAWLAGLALQSEIPPDTKHRAKRGGGMPKPEWFPMLQTIVAAYRERAKRAAERQKTIAFPTNRSLAAQIETDSKGRWRPLADTVGKHAKEMRNR